MQVRFVKNKKHEETPASTKETTVEGIAAIAGYTIDRGIKKIGMFCIGYVVLDTVRQVLVAQATKS